jgi:uncharacterized protein (TIGR04255 family)
MAYRKNYLAQVIFQLRFDPILLLEKEPPADFQQAVKERFPKVTEGQEIEIETRMSLVPETRADFRRVRPRWVLGTKDASRSLTVSSTMFSLEYTRYENIEATRDDFEFLWSRFQKAYGVDSLSRVGLRYVDRVLRPEGDPLEWDKWIADPLISATLPMEPPPGHDLCRSMHALHWVGDDHRITFQFGIFNAHNFPGPVVQKEYILDYDCSSIGAVEAAEVLACLTKYHDLLSVLFKNSIGEDMRSDMDSGDGSGSGGGETGQ